MRSYHITLQSTDDDYDYILYEDIELADNHNIIHWLFRESTVSEALIPFLGLDVFEFKYTVEDDIAFIRLYLKDTIPTINILDATKDVRYIIPYHESLQHVHYFKYFCMMYTCEHAHEINECLYEDTLSEWIYAEIAETNFSISYKEHQDNIYAGTCLVMEDKEILPEEFHYTLLQQHG